MNAVVNVREHHRLNFNRLPAMAKQQLDIVQLTPMYEEAKRSIVALVRVDEVKEIADKHTAIAHYAKQIKDNSLLYYAERVYARALKRIGELMEELPFKERNDTGKAHGLSLGDAQHAINIAALPAKVFERFVEQTPPLSKNKLSLEGNRLRFPEKHSHGYNKKENKTNFETHVEKEPASKIAKLINQIDYFRVTANLDRHSFLIGKDISKITRDDATLLRKKLQPLIEFLDGMDQLLKQREDGE
jgi:hypothetical protein